MSELFGGGSQTVKTKAQLPPETAAIQSLLVRLMLARLSQDGGMPMTFGEFRRSGPRAMPRVAPTSKEQSTLGISPALIGQTAGLSPWLVNWLAGGTVPGAISGVNLSGGGGSGITSGGLAGFGGPGI